MSAWAKTTDSFFPTMTTPERTRAGILEDAALPDPLELPVELELGLGKEGFFILEELLLPISLLQEHKKSAQPSARKRG
jgi:hypothetical protein